MGRRAGPLFCVRIHHAGYSLAQLRTLWRTAERLGFDGVSLYDVLQPRAFECWTTLSILSMMTRRVTAIPLVLDVGYRYPVLLAKMAATLDQLTGGNRLILGLGYGGNPADHQTYGFDWPPTAAQRVARLESQVKLMRSLWSGTSDAPGFPTATPGGPPVLIASRGRRHGLAGVARSADLCNISFDLSPAEWQEYQHVLAQHSSRRVGLTHNATVVIGHTRAEAEQSLEALARSRHLTREQARHGMASALVGTPSEIVERLLSYREAGVDLAWVFVLFPDLPSTRSLRLFGEEVLPAYRESVSRSQVAALSSPSR